MLVQNSNKGNSATPRTNLYLSGCTYFSPPKLWLSPFCSCRKKKPNKKCRRGKKKKKYVCFLVIVEVRVSHLSYAFFSNWYVCTYSIMFSKNLYLERTRRFFWKKNNTKRSPSNPHQKWKLFSFEIVLRGRMVLCKIHAAIYTIAAAASAASASFWKMQ